MTTANQTMHIFEQAGLGRAPYRYLGIEKQHTGCQFCATAIMFKFWLLSADGKKFFVGSDCILKSGDAGLKRLIDADLKKHQKELRLERENTVLSLFEGYLSFHPEFWTADGPFKGPHPFRYYAAQGRTMADYQKFCFDHSGRSTKAKLARTWLIMVGEMLPARQKGKKVKKGADATAPAV